jgi:hypothetical protein
MIDALTQFLAGPNPNTLPVNSVGTCTFCKQHGPGPGHECPVWNEHHPKPSPPKSESKVFDRTLDRYVSWSQASALDPLSLARVTIELLRDIEWQEKGGGTYTCPSEGSWSYAKRHWEDCALASVLAHAEATYAALNAPRKHRITVRRSLLSKGELERIYVDGHKVSVVYRDVVKSTKWHWVLDAHKGLNIVDDARGYAPDRVTARKAAVKHIRKCLRAYARKVHIETSPIGGFDLFVGDVIVGNVREDRFCQWRWKIDPNPLGIAPRGWSHECARQEEAQLAGKP